MTYRDYLRLSCEAEQEAVKYEPGTPRFEAHMKQARKFLDAANDAPRER
jgi:hypothetical protein